MKEKPDPGHVSKCNAEVGRLLRVFGKTARRPKILALSQGVRGRTARCQSAKDAASAGENLA